jgi:hypothetical protein
MKNAAENVRRIAAEPHPAARATIKRNRPPVPRWRGGGEADVGCASSSWARAIAGEQGPVKHVIVARMERSGMRGKIAARHRPGFRDSA